MLAVEVNGQEFLGRHIPSFLGLLGAHGQGQDTQDPVLLEDGNADEVDLEPS
jgi:hypothetical protein